MMQKTHLAQNRSTPFPLRPIFVQEESVTSSEFLVFTSFNKKTYSAKLIKTPLLTSLKSAKIKYSTQLS